LKIYLDDDANNTEDVPLVDYTVVNTEDKTQAVSHGVQEHLLGEYFLEEFLEAEHQTQTCHAHDAADSKQSAEFLRSYGNEWQIQET
jgi:hypothetical protein